jgi:hypothetical protein
MPSGRSGRPRPPHPVPDIVAAAGAHPGKCSPISRICFLKGKCRGLMIIEGAPPIAERSRHVAHPHSRLAALVVQVGKLLPLSVPGEIIVRIDAARCKQTFGNSCSAFLRGNQQSRELVREIFPFRPDGPFLQQHLTSHAGHSLGVQRGSTYSRFWHQHSLAKIGFSESQLSFCEAGPKRLTCPVGSSTTRASGRIFEKCSHLSSCHFGLPGTGSYIFTTDKGFCVDPKSSTSEIFLGKDGHCFDENIVSLRPWLAHIVLQTIEACSDIMSSLASVVAFPEAIAPDYLTFIRDPSNQALIRLIDVAKGNLVWWGAEPIDPTSA